MKILLADDHPMVRTGLKLLLSRAFEQCCVLEARDYPEAIKICQDNDDLALILLDRMMPGMNSLDGLKSIYKIRSDTPIVILSASEDPDLVWESLDHGAKGYITKSSSEEILTNALQLVLSGSTYLPQALLDQRKNHSPKPRASVTAAPEENISPTNLTKRQLEVLGLLVSGNSNKGIARSLDISEATVNTHVNAIFRCLNVNNRTEASNVAIKKRLISI